MPVVHISAADGPDLSLTLRYDSLLAKDSEVTAHAARYRNMVLGPGWTHSFNGFATKDGANYVATELMVITPNGQRRSEPHSCK